jgi:hypothetical protein
MEGEIATKKSIWKTFSTKKNKDQIWEIKKLRENEFENNFQY